MPQPFGCMAAQDTYRLTITSHKHSNYYPMITKANWWFTNSFLVEPQTVGLLYESCNGNISTYATQVSCMALQGDQNSDLWVNGLAHLTLGESLSNEAISLYNGVEGECHSLLQDGKCIICLCYTTVAAVWCALSLSPFVSRIWCKSPFN